MDTKVFRFEQTGVSVGTAATTLVTITPSDVNCYGVLAFELDNNSGGQALNALNLQVLQHGSSTWVNYITADAGWTEDTNNVLWLSGSPEDLASGSVANACVALWGHHSIRIQATVASSTATVDIRGSVNGKRS